MKPKKTRLSGVQIQVRSKLDALDPQILSWRSGTGLLWITASVPARGGRRQEEPTKAAVSAERRCCEGKRPTRKQRHVVGKIVVENRWCLSRSKNVGVIQKSPLAARCRFLACSRLDRYLTRLSIANQRAHLCYGFVLLKKKLIFPFAMKKHPWFFRNGTTGTRITRQFRPWI